MTSTRRWTVRALMSTLISMVNWIAQLARSTVMLRGILLRHGAQRKAGIGRRMLLPTLIRLAVSYANSWIMFLIEHLIHQVLWVAGYRRGAGDQLMVSIMDPLVAAS